MSNRRIPKRQSQRARSGRERRTGLGARLMEVHHRARDEVNQRGHRRQMGMTRQAAIAGSTQDFEEDFLPLTWVKRVLHWGFAFLLVPLCFVTIISLLKVSGEETLLTRVWYSTEFICFLVGIGSMVSWFIAGIFNDRFLYLYVLGHELTHAMFVFAFLGRVSGIHVSSQGGYIMTNKSNIVIALSPYFVPFWSVVLILLHSLIEFFTDIPAGDLILMGFLGLTWTFHVIWTVWMIPKDQPDLKEHGTIFSLMIIIFANLLLITVMICATSREVQLVDFAFTWWNNCLDLGEAGWRLLTSR